jgi:hypothetical protein
MGKTKEETPQPGFPHFLSPEKLRTPGRRHRPTEDTRAAVKALAAFGVPQEEICLYIGINDKSLRKHYRDELGVGPIFASARVAQSLFNRAINGDVAAQIFWLKARAGWTERVHLQHEFSKLSDEELVRRTMAAFTSGSAGSGAAALPGRNAASRSDVPGADDTD